MKMPCDFLKNLMICTIALPMAGCAPGKEFQAVPQAGAKRTGVYPRFSQQPKAETSQFTEEDRARLTHELEGEAQRLRSSSRSPVSSVYSASERKRDAERETQEVLKQITEGKK